MIRFMVLADMQEELYISVGSVEHGENMDIEVNVMITF
jgi:hypothetical protein